MWVAASVFDVDMEDNPKSCVREITPGTELHFGDLYEGEVFIQFFATQAEAQTWLDEQQDLSDDPSDNEDDEDEL